MTPVRHPLKVAVIGCGPIGTLHAEAIRGFDRANLVAVCDCDAIRASELGRRLAVSSYSSLAEFLANQRPDAVIIATPDHTHYSVCLEAISAGCHVFCEKPLCTSLNEARRVVADARQRGVHLGVNYNRRFGFGYRLAHQMIQDGRIGRIMGAVIHVCDKPPKPEITDPYFMFTSLLTHHIDLVRWICGEIVGVGARFGQASAHGIVSTASIHFECDGGSLATIFASYRDGQTRTSEQMIVYGESGSLTIDDVTRKVTLSGRDPDHIQVFHPNHFAGGDDFLATISEHVRDFVRRVAESTEPFVTGLDGLRGLELVAAAVQSHREGRVIERL